MLKMSRDALEVNTNMVGGAVINCVITYYLFGVSPEFALLSTGIFFVTSWLRSYGFRKLFRYLENKQLEDIKNV
jgi:hypothetical protein